MKCKFCKWKCRLPKNIPVSYTHLDVYKRQEDYREADFAILFIRPSSGEYFHSTKGYLELDICENKQVRDVDSEGNYYELDFGLTLE